MLSDISDYTSKLVCAALAFNRGLKVPYTVKSFRFDGLN